MTWSTNKGGSQSKKEVVKFHTSPLKSVNPINIFFKHELTNVLVNKKITNNYHQYRDRHKYKWSWLNPGNLLHQDIFLPQQLLLLYNVQSTCLYKSCHHCHTQVLVETLQVGCRDNPGLSPENLLH